MALHSVHAGVVPVPSSEKDAAGHVVHADVTPGLGAPDVEKVPAGHGPSHALVKESPSPYLPASQLTHTVSPSTSVAYEPAAHAQPDVGTAPQPPVAVQLVTGTLGVPTVFASHAHVALVLPAARVAA